MDKYAVVTVTAKDKAEAHMLAEHLLRRKLVACVSLVDSVESHYWWKNQIEQASECLMVMKTREDLFPSIEKFVLEHHSYEVPEILMLPIVKGHEDYLFWIKKNVENI